MDRLKFLPSFLDLRSARLGAVAVALTSVLCLGVLTLGVYNIYFHKLSKFPGPLLFRAYHFPFVYYHASGTLARKITTFHEQYGPVVRVSPTELAFTSGEAWNDIYGLLPGRAQNAKDHYW